MALPCGKQDRDLALGEVPALCQRFELDLCPWVHGLSAGQPLQLPGISPQR